VYGPWKMKDIRRLYVNSAEGKKLGYVDLATLDVVLDSEATELELRAALSALGATAEASRTVNDTRPAPAAALPANLPGKTWPKQRQLAGSRAWRTPRTRPEPSRSNALPACWHPWIGPATGSCTPCR